MDQNLILVESWIMPHSNDGWLLSEFFWIALSVVVVIFLSIIVLGCNHFISWLLVSGGM
jgi:hypothetical protein